MNDNKPNATKEIIGLNAVAATKIVAIIHHDLVLCLSSTRFASGRTFPQMKKRSVAKIKMPNISPTTIITSELEENFSMLSLKNENTLFILTCF
jgi:hypothetical protein